MRATYVAALPLLTAIVVPMSAAYAQTPAATMTVLTPKPNEKLGANKFNLDVRFKTLTNSPVVTAELWVDGVRWVRRDLDAPRRASVLSFLVDGSTLSAGAHTIVVKVLNAEGDVSSAKVNVVAGSDEAAGEAAWGGPEVRFVSPGNGKKIVGTVELLVDAKSRNGQNPYVSFYVDDKFKALNNYPPYTFVWDTTNETNGVHTITASGYLDSANATTTRTITVYVNNPGGNTVRMSEIPDLSAAKSARKTTPGATVAKPLMIPLPNTVGTVIAAPKGDARITESAMPSLHAGDSLGLSATEASASAAQSAAPVSATPKLPAFTPAPVARFATPKIPTVSTNAVPSVASEPTLSVATGSVPDAMDLGIEQLASIEIAAPKMSSSTPRLSRPANIVATPMRVASATPTPKAVVSLAAPTVVVAKPVATNPRTSVSVPKAKTARRTDAMKPIQVAFDGERIAFDVAPHVEAGMPVAPFRQIFEHTGGRVSWSNQTKTMRATNSNREIVIGVGSKSATVNGAKVSMDRAAVLDRGRTVVPLNFVGKALDVNVQYDPVTGRLSITSKN
ncbi:MAG: hypothetical protein H8F28_20155 [Fibrella sp.]|nr:hypothetical protein [Armatimonadota bacterium]